MIQRSAGSPARTWSARIAVACLVLAGALFVLAAAVEVGLVTWAGIGDGLSRIPWPAVGLGATGLALLTAPIIVRSRVRARSGSSGPSMTVLRGWMIVAAAATVGLATWGGTAWLLSEANRSTDADRPKARVDAIRSGLSVGAGTGGAIALLLAARRQWHQEKVAIATDHDAAERRITELYTKAAEQLGNENAPVRLAGLYALERLAQNNPEHRQTIIDVICAYLRMPFTPPAIATPMPISGESPQASSRDATDGAGATDDLESVPAAEDLADRPHRRQQEELQVRLTAQEILTRHLTRPRDLALVQARGFTARTDHPFWPGHSLNLTNAHLTRFTLNRGYLVDANFANATFTGHAEFNKATFTGEVSVGGATFTGDARFGGATFTSDARFSGATFSRNANFDSARFLGDAWFGGVTFDGDASFNGVTIAGKAGLGRARFEGTAGFGEATFAQDVWFGGATFNGDAWFNGATFTGDAGFDRAVFRNTRFNRSTFSSEAGFHRATFTGNAWFDGATFNGNAKFVRATFTLDAKFGRATFVKNARFERATFTRNAQFDRATFTGDAKFVEAVFTSRARFVDATFAVSPDMAGAQSLNLSVEQWWPVGWVAVPQEIDRSRGHLVFRPAG